MRLFQKRNLKLIFIVLYLLLLGYHLFQLYMGRASVITTVLFYVTLAICFLLIIRLLRVVFKLSGVGEKNIQLIIISSLIFLLVLELYLRYGKKSYLSYTEQNKHFYYQSEHRKLTYYYYRYGTKPEWYWLNAKSYSYYNTQPEFSFLHSFNSLGLRGEEIHFKKDSSEYRIVGLGDSMTEGIGAPQDSTWPVFLGRILHEEYPTRKITTINAGVSGSDPFYEFALLRDRLLDYKPDLVIVAINNSDFYDILVRGDMERFKPDGTVKYQNGPWWEYVYSFSFILRNVVRSIFNYNYMLLPESKMTFYTEQVNGQLIALLRDYAKLSEEKNFELLVISAPVRPEIIYTDLRYIQSMDRIKELTGIETIDLYDPLVNEFGISDSNIYNYYWKIDGHANSRGYELIAKCVADKISEMGTIK